MSEKEISEKMQEIMERMKQRREDLDMSYQTLADKVGISKSTLQRYETGNIRNMPIDKLEAVADALNVSPAYLMGWDSEYKPSTMAAHLDTDDLTDTEREDVANYIEFIKAKRNK